VASLGNDLAAADSPANQALPSVPGGILKSHPVAARTGGLGPRGNAGAGCHLQPGRPLRVARRRAAAQRARVGDAAGLERRAGAAGTGAGDLGCGVGGARGGISAMRGWPGGRSLSSGPTLSSTRTRRRSRAHRELEVLCSAIMGSYRRPERMRRLLGTLFGSCGIFGAHTREKNPQRRSRPKSRPRPAPSPGLAVSAAAATSRRSSRHQRLPRARRRHGARPSIGGSRGRARCAPSRPRCRYRRDS
jgi:hypothetical protein